ncbi:MAG: DinB family protein [Planctomycetota bacterium]
MSHSADLVRDLVRDNVRVLAQLRATLDRLPDAAYADAAPELGLASIGSHVRHVIDFYACFTTQLASGSVDYDLRARDARLECDSRAAVDACSRAEELLRTCEADGVLDVRMEGGPWTRSSRARELAALCSHAVHHFALIAVLLRRAGESVDADFGVAPSTLRYWEASGGAPRR